MKGVLASTDRAILLQIMSLQQIIVSTLSNMAELKQDQVVTLAQELAKSDNIFTLYSELTKREELRTRYPRPEATPEEQHDKLLQEIKTLRDIVLSENFKAIFTTFAQYQPDHVMQWFEEWVEPRMLNLGIKMRRPA